MSSQQFLEGLSGSHYIEGIKGNWDNHRLLLLIGIELTSGPVIELGAGDGSTSYLRNTCQFKGRDFYSYDNNQEWAKKCGSRFIEDWDKAPIWNRCGLLFVDHAPGEHRKVAVGRMADKADIIVVHDTEQGGAGDYQLEPVLSQFKYRLNYNKNGGGAGATAVSNFIDLNRFRGLSLGQYTFDDH